MMTAAGHFRTVLVITCLVMFTATANATADRFVGQAAPEFLLKTSTGSKLSLSSLRKKGHVLLVFWTTNCVYCLAEIPHLNKIDARYKNKGLTVAAININSETETEVNDYITENGVKYLVFNDRVNNIDVVNHYNITATPTLILISPGGKIEYYGHNVPDMQNWIKAN